MARYGKPHQAHHQERKDRRSGEHPLYASRFMSTGNIEHREHNDSNGTVNGRPVFTQRKQNLGVVTVNEGYSGNGTCLDDGTPGPPEQHGNRRPPCTLKERVFTTGIRMGTAQLGIAQRTHQHHKPTRQPEQQIRRRGSNLLRYQGRETENTNSDDHAYQHGNSISDRQTGSLIV